MVMTMKLQHVDELSGGRKRFRRRCPKAVAKALGEDFFQVPMQAREGAALVAEQEKLVREFDRMVAKAKGEAPEVTAASRPRCQSVRFPLSAMLWLPPRKP